MDFGLGQRTVAALLGVAPDTVCGWEKGRATPRLRHLPEIIRFLGHDPRPIPDTLAGQIRHLRQARGWTTRDLGRQLGVDPSTVHDWERLGFNPTPRLYARIVKVLRIPEPAGNAPIGQRLRARRLALGLTQKEAGRLAGVCGDTVSGWESGKKEPPSAFIELLTDHGR